jgi:hypothetical protein
MRSKLMGVAITVLVLAGTSWAQEPGEEPEAARSVETRRPLRVLQHPYDIASFYRSSQGSYGLYGPVDLLPPNAYGGRYPIAGFYRSRQGNYFGLQTPVTQNPYAIAGYYRSSAGPDVRFWYGGYGRVRPAPRRGGYSRYWSTIGENGDLFLMAPTFLAPVGALSALYYSGN